jgi:hypothetical protein
VSLTWPLPCNNERALKVRLVSGRRRQFFNLPGANKWKQLLCARGEKFYLNYAIVIQ